MPQMPDRERSGFLQTEVPRSTGPITSHGANHDALVNLGGNIANIALDLQAKQSQADDQQFLTNKDTEDLLATSKFMREQKLKVPANGAGYTDAIQNFVNDRREKNISEAPSRASKEAYSRNSLNTMTRHLVDAGGYEQELKVKSMISDMSSNVSAFARTQVSLPDKELSLERMVLYEHGFQNAGGNLFSEVDAASGAKAARTQISKGYLDGLYNTGRHGELLNTLKQDSNGPEGAFGAALTPDQKDTYIKNSQTKMKLDREVTYSQNSKRATDLITRAMYKGDVSDSDIDKAIASNKRLSNVNPLGAAELNDNLLSAKIVQNNLAKLRNASNNELLASKSTMEAQIQNATAQGSQDKTYNFANKLKFLKMNSDAVDSKIKFREENGVEASMENDVSMQELHTKANGNDPAAMQEFISRSKDIQLKLGVRPDKVRVLTDQKISEIAQTINTAQSPTQISNSIEAYQNTFGSDFPKAFMEASDETKGGIPKEYIAVATVSNPEFRKQLIDNIQNKKAILNESKEDQITEMSVRTKVRAEFQDMFSALGGTPKNFADGFFEAAKLEVNRQVNLKVNLNTAVTSVVNKFYKENYDKVTAGRGSVLVPKGGGHKPEMVESFLKVYSPKLSAEMASNLKELDITPSAEAKGSFVSKGLSEAEANSAYQKVVMDSGKWITSPDQSGIMFVIDSGNRQVPIKDSKGQNIYRSYKDITNTNDVKVLKAAQPVMKKFTKMLGF